MWSPIRSTVKPGDIRYLCKTPNLTQQQFAELLGVSFVTLDRWENRQTRPSMLGLARLQGEHGQPTGDAREAPPRLDFQGDSNALREATTGHPLRIWGMAGIGDDNPVVGQSIVDRINAVLSQIKEG